MTPIHKAIQAIFAMDCKGYNDKDTTLVKFQRLYTVKAGVQYEELDLHIRTHYRTYLKPLMGLKAESIARSFYPKPTGESVSFFPEGKNESEWDIAQCQIDRVAEGWIQTVLACNNVIEGLKHNQIFYKNNIDSPSESAFKARYWVIKQLLDSQHFASLGVFATDGDILSNVCLAERMAGEILRHVLLVLKDKDNQHTNNIQFKHNDKDIVLRRTNAQNLFFLESLANSYMLDKKIKHAGNKINLRTFDYGDTDFSEQLDGFNDYILEKTKDIKPDLLLTHNISFLPYDEYRSVIAVYGYMLAFYTYNEIQSAIKQVIETYLVNKRAVATFTNINKENLYPKENVSDLADLFKKELLDAAYMMNGTVFMPTVVTVKGNAYRGEDIHVQRLTLKEIALSEELTAEDYILEDALFAKSEGADRILLEQQFKHSLLNDHEKAEYPQFFSERHSNMEQKRAIYRTQAKKKHPDIFGEIVDYKKPVVLTNN